MKDVILVFGSARSGTSWLSELMAKPMGYRLLFEPEHEQYVPEGRMLADKLLTECEESGTVNLFLKKLFGNKIDNDWIAQNSYRKYKMHLWPFLVRKKIVKFVRCNLSMYHMTQHFSVPAVYVRRNVYDTLFSQQRVKFPWLYDLSRFSEQDMLCRELWQRYKVDIVNESFGDLEKLAVRWCIENIFLKDLFIDNKNSIHFIQYEEIKGNVARYEELIRKLKLEPTRDLKRLVNLPSSKTHPKSTIRRSEGKSEIVRQGFAESDKEIINSILVRFNGIETI